VQRRDRILVGIVEVDVDLVRNAPKHRSVVALPNGTEEAHFVRLAILGLRFDVERVLVLVTNPFFAHSPLGRRCRTSNR